MDGFACLCEDAQVRLMILPTEGKVCRLMPTRKTTHSDALVRGHNTCLRRDGGTALELPREIDISNASDVVENLCRQLVGPKRTIRVDVAEVTFMDSSGIAACLKAQQSARQAGYQMVFVNPSAQVTRVIEVLGLERVLLGGLPS